MKHSHILFILAALLVVSACGNKKQGGMQQPGAVPVSVQQVKSTYAPYYDEYPATVVALNEVALRPQVSGYITGIHFKEGQQVKKGQKLYSIDQQQTAAGYKQALANLSVQEANLEKAKKDVERYRLLSKKDAIAQQQVDYAEANYNAALKLVEAAKAQVQSSQTLVRYSSIVAPFDGTIGISQVRLGASVVPGQTLLNTLSSNNPMGVDIVVDQDKIFQFSALEKATSMPDSLFVLTVGNYQHPHAGKLSFIDRAVDPLTSSIKIRFEFDNSDYSLRAGMSGKLKVLSNTSAPSITIPYKAVTEQLGEFFVYVVSKENTVTQHQVKLGQQVGSHVIVTQGLKTNETIVTEGMQKLREGAKVQFTTSNAVSQK